MTTIHNEIAVLDLWELMTRCMGKPELAGRVLQRFVKQLDGDVEHIAASLSSGDVTTARDVAHRLKGTAANVAAHTLREQAHALESAIQMELTDHYDVIFAGLVAERDRFLEALQQTQFG